jgi:threonine dehydrogenase-like Zn-dependent dehydrogenase
MSTRKYATIDGSGVIGVEEGPVPECGTADVLVDVHASLISSGTELGGVPARRKNPNPAGKPRPFGYQNAGDVIGRGSECTEYEVGTRVACMGGGYALHTTTACVPKNLTVPIPDNVSYEEAAFNHLAATALQAIRRADLELGFNVAVVGLGTIGQIACQLARISGCRVMGLDRFPLRLRIAKELGADVVVNVNQDDPVPIAQELTGGEGMDCAIMAFGGDGTEAFRQIVQMMKETPDTHRMGNIVIVGGAQISHTFAAGLGNLNVLSSARTGPGYHDEAWERGDEYPDVLVRWTTRRNLALCLRLISEGKLKVEPLITHRYPLEQAPEACEKIIQTPEETLSIVLTMK